MKKTKLTRSLLAACSIVALSAVMYGCTGDGSKNDLVASQEALEQEKEAHAATTAEVTRLSTALGAEMDPDPDSARGMLAAANDRIGSADDPESLLGMLDAEQKEAIRLTQVIDGDGTDANPGLQAELDAANDRIGSADDPESLLGMLDAEQKKAEMYRVAIEGDGTDANPGLQAELDAAKLRIAALEAGTAEDVLNPIKEAASGAATAAGEASTAAGTAADEAEAAAAEDGNRATLQIGDDADADSTVGAKAAREAAMAAVAAAKDAADASTAAQDAANAGDATPHKNAAEAARDVAMEAQTAAETARDDAVADSMVELKIRGTVKRVGDTMIDATAGSSVVTVGEDDDRQTTHTGQITGMTPMTTGDGAGVGVAGVQDDPDTDTDEAVKHVQVVADRTFGIGKVVDSADDAARLMIITQYAGSNNVYVYNEGSSAVTGTKAGYLTIEDTDTTENDENNVRLKSEGTFYAAGTSSGGEGNLSQDGEVGDETEGVQVFSYVDVADSDEKKYVVLTTESKSSGTTTYTYNNVDVEVEVAAAGDEEAYNTRVRAAIPEATDYDHIHFGVWAALGEAEQDGSQKIADHGIGFVQNYSDGGMTGADMPNNGDATYSGSWVATVETADEDGNGAINLESGDASVIADFGKDTIEADLDSLATLSGDVTGNTFSGTKASDIIHGSLDAEADFEGSFSGGFYGAKAAEAGGVFDFASDDGEGGAFRGAFGGQRTD